MRVETVLYISRGPSRSPLRPQKKRVKLMNDIESCTGSVSAKYKSSTHEILSPDSFTDWLSPAHSRHDHASFAQR